MMLMKGIPRKKLTASVFAIAALLIFIIILVVTAPESEKKGKKTSAETTTSVTEISTTFTETTLVQTTTTLPHIDYPSCNAAALYCVDDKQILYSDNINKKSAPASITKLLTASVALEYAGKGKSFTVGSEQALVQPYSSLCGFSLGDTMKIEDMITGMLMASGNDAAYTIAVSTAREMLPDANMTDSEAVDFFCGLMNTFANDHGMNDSSFVNPDGWDDKDQYTTAADLLKLGEYVLTVPEITSGAQTFKKNITLTSGGYHSFTNSNLLLDPDSKYYCKEAIGLKTGTTQNAGNSLIAAFDINGKKYISVVLGCDEDEDRYELTTKLIDYIK